MARIAGRNGRLYMGLASSTAVAEPVAYIRDWSITFQTSPIDVTAMGDSGTVYVGGLPDITGSYAGFYDNATAQMYTAATDGQARRFYLYPDATDSSEYFWGTAVFDMNVEAAVDGSVQINGDFQAASAISKQV